MSTAKFNTWLNPNGTENYKCRAWVNFDGTGTVAIRASGNVSSITDNGTGQYTVNFTTAMPDANYSAVVTQGRGVSGVSSFVALAPDTSDPTTTAIRLVVVTSAGGVVDARYINVAIHR
jgi:succinyl-CoA synthetase alpha subunit